MKKQKINYYYLGALVTMMGVYYFHNAPLAILTGLSWIITKKAFTDI